MPKIDRQAIYERDQGLCGFCGQPVPLELLHLDHYPVPRALGGTTVPENLRVAHRRCNVRAGREVRLRRRMLGLPSLRPPNVVTIRFPNDLHRELTDYAQEHGRPFTAQVIYWLRNDLEMVKRGEYPKP